MPDLIHLSGYSLGAVLGTFAAFGALATLLYVLKLRRRPIAVVFSPIWKQVLGEREASRLFSRLKRLLSLLIALTLLFLLALSLGDPRLSAREREARHLVVLVDSSASMLSRDVAPSRLGVARERVLELTRGLGLDDRMLIAQLDATVTPLSTMTGDLEQLEQALEQLDATDTAADLSLGLSFALDSLRDRENAEIVLVSDGAHEPLDPGSLPDLGDVTLRQVRVGDKPDNVAITALSVRRYPLDRSRYEVMLSLDNAGPRPVEVDLELLGDGRVVETSRVSLAPGQSTSRFYPEMGGASATLEARISAPLERDYLARDNRAYAMMPARKRIRVLVVTSGNTYLEAALLLDEYLDVSQVAPGDALPDGRFDVTILDGVAVPYEPRLGGTFYLNVPERGAPVSRRRALAGFGFDRHVAQPPLLRFIAPENVQVAKGYALEPQASDVVVGASVQGPLLIAGRRGEERFVALGFDPRDSDLVLRVAWPLLVLNVVHHFVEERDDFLSSRRTGEVWALSGLGGADAAFVTREGAESSQRVVVRDGQASLLGQLSGFYSVSPSPGGEPLLRFAANLSSVAETRIEPREEGALEGAEALASGDFESRARHEVWAYILVAVLIASCVEWLTYHRRLTV